MEVFRNNCCFVDAEHKNIQKNGNCLKKQIVITRITRSTGITSILILILLSLATINPIYIKSEYAEATTGTATESMLTFNSTSTTASVNLAISSKTGTFATSGTNEKAAFSISTNNYTGYTLTLKSTGSDTNLTSNDNNSITTLPSSTTYDVFSSSEATGQTLNNRWGFIPNYYNSIANTTNYYPAPTSSDVAVINSTIEANSVDGISNADTYTIGLGIRANYASAAGTYTNDTFILEYIANPITYSITFSDNTSDSTVANLPSTMSSSTLQTSVTLPSAAPTRTGYTFNKWCLGTVSDNGTTCTGTEYVSSASFGIDQTIDNTNITLYATWTLNCIALPSGTGIMQTYTITPEVLASVCEGSSTTLTDRRDNNTYTVTKIQGTLWMTQNLRITGVVSSLDSNFTTYDSVNVCKSDLTSGNSYTEPRCHDSGNNTNGVWYNYAAASAETIVGDTNNTTTKEDICPAGWRLPDYNTNNTAGSINSLFVTSAASTDYFTPVAGGYYGDETLNNTSYGLWWSNAANDSINRYYLYSNGNSLTINVNDGRRYDGFYIRCVLETRTIEDITYMQDITPRIIANTPAGTATTLLDNRDNKEYNVAKLADDNIWMTQNLDHDIVTTNGFYTFANTDLGHGSTPNTSATWTANTATYATDDTTWNYRTNEPESYNPGDLCWNGTLGNYNLTTGTTACGNDKHMHIGNYYNWTAAVAMNNSSSYTTGEEDVDQSICPAGWRLPTLDGDKSYDNLVTTLGLTPGTSGNIQNAPAYFVYGGERSGSSGVVGGRGNYWSSVISDNSYAYELGFDSNDSISTIIRRYYGISIRCVARTKTIKNLVYMQDFSTLTSSEKTDILNYMTTNTQYQLKDNRDGKAYYVAKLADGNIWMTQNLDHDIVTTTDFYTPQNTDIQSNWTASIATYASNTTTWALHGSTPTGYDVPQSYDPGDVCWNGAIRNDWNGTIASETTVCDNNRHYQIGNYYNLNAAFAMNTNHSYDAIGTRINQSICPAGWRLPANSGDQSYESLVANLNLTAGNSGNIHASPTYFTYTGTWNGYSSSTSARGFYWSNEIYDQSGTDILYFDKDGNIIEEGLGMHQENTSGTPIRCMVR
ncbi:hypothetical protein IKT18_02560 [Candidatus Saccharibacteria bacterium]|nr:hypothetical protein [Candidatus Saccharibacteria bacterium]